MIFTKRYVINSVLVISGGLTALSGFFLLFHYESHFTKAVHEIGALLLVLFAVIHIVVNWRALASSLKERLSVRAVIIVFAVCIAIMAVTGSRDLHKERVQLHEKERASNSYFMP